MFAPGSREPDDVGAIAVGAGALRNKILRDNWNPICFAIHTGLDPDL